MEKLLSFEEVRILGSLIEKEVTTPEYYPLTVNSLKNACNQKSNRDPVVSFDETVIEDTLENLRARPLVSRVTGSDMRVPKYRQILTEELEFSPAETAVMCVLMLRGPQTPGEIKGRTTRLFNFESLNQLEEVMQNLINREYPLIKKLPRQPGTKESRYVHLLSGEPEIDFTLTEQTSNNANGKDEKIKALEDELNSVKEELAELKQRFEDFQKQFE